MAAEHFTRADAIFTPEVVKQLAEIGQFQPTADLDVFREMLCPAAGFYFEDIDTPDRNKIYYEMEDLYYGKLKLDDASEITRYYLRQRAERLGRAWPPAPEHLPNLAAFGMKWVCDTKRAKNRRKLILAPELFAQKPEKHPKKRLAATVFTARLIAAYEHANNKPAPKTATIRFSTQSDETLIGPFARLVREVFRLCGTPEVHVARSLERAKKLMEKTRPDPEI